MNTKDRFFEAYNHLKNNGEIQSYTELAEKLHTNKAGISDLRAGRKKIALAHLNYMKISYPKINIEWIITGKGEIIKEKEETEPNLKDTYIIELQKERIKTLESNIEGLETTVKELKKELDKAYGSMATDVEHKLKKEKQK